MNQMHASDLFILIDVYCLTMNFFFTVNFSIFSLSRLLQIARLGKLPCLVIFLSLVPPAYRESTPQIMHMTQGCCVPEGK